MHSRKALEDFKQMLPYLDLSFEMKTSIGITETTSKFLATY